MSVKMLKVVSATVNLLLGLVVVFRKWEQNEKTR
jgi:hypothetical protein